MLAIEGVNREDMRTGRSRITATGTFKGMHVAGCARDAERRRVDFEERGGVTKVLYALA